MIMIWKHPQTLMGLVIDDFIIQKTFYKKGNETKSVSQLLAMLTAIPLPVAYNGSPVFKS